MLSFFDRLSRAFITAWSYFFFALGCILWGVLVIPLTVVLSHFWPSVRDWFSDCTHIAIRIFVGLLPFVKLRVDRSRRLGDEFCVLVVNHQSWLDPLVMLALERRLSGPARGYLFRVPVMGTVLKLGRFYLSEKGEPAPLDRMRRGAKEALEHRGTLLFFPEGTRTKTGEIDHFHMGAFRMAVEYQLPIQPVVIEGLYHVFPSGSPIVRARGRYPVRVHYLDPVKPPYGEGSQRRVVRELAQKVHLSMVEELNRLKMDRASTGQEQPDNV